VTGLARSVPMFVTIRNLLLIFLRGWVYQKTMTPQEATQDRPCR